MPPACARGIARGQMTAGLDPVQLWAGAMVALMRVRPPPVPVFGIDCHFKVYSGVALIDPVNSPLGVSHGSLARRGARQGGVRGEERGRGTRWLRPRGGGAGESARRAHARAQNVYPSVSNGAVGIAVM